MARKPRIAYPGALYHVILRGNQKQKVFLDDKDRLDYLDRLQRYGERYNVTFYAYTLMDNHVHILLETGREPLYKVMQGLNQSYTQYFNRRHHTVGHLFQGRYKAILCDQEAYLLELVRYIHLNPVRAKITSDAGLYPWSSHQVYLGREERGFINTDTVLSQFSRERTTARQEFDKFVSEGIKGSHRGEYYREVLGDREFIEEVFKKTKSDLKAEDKRRYSLDDVVGAVESITGVNRGRLISKERKPPISLARNLLVYVAKRHSFLKGKEVADFLKRDPSLLVRMERMWETERQRDKWVEMILEELRVQSQA